ncbi:MAG: hypothetical protein ACO23B_09230, partial [Burkholderiaceae bacterium]
MLPAAVGGLRRPVFARRGTYQYGSGFDRFKINQQIQTGHRMLKDGLAVVYPPPGCIVGLCKQVQFHCIQPFAAVLSESKLLLPISSWGWDKPCVTGKRGVAAEVTRIRV